MSEADGRKLRPRRMPHYPHADNQDADNFAYTRTSFIKDFVSPAQQLNSMAKLLSKFINSANKKLIEKSNVNEHRETTSSKKKPEIVDQTTRKGQMIEQDGKKKQNNKNELKEHNVKGAREIGGLKDLQRQQLEAKQKLKNPDHGKKQRQFNKTYRPGQKMDDRTINTYPAKIEQLKNMQSLQMGQMSIKKLKEDAAAKAIQQQQQLLKYNPSLKQKLEPHMKKQQFGSDKFFKRGAYHIAIAYNIHLKNIKENDRQRFNPLIIDPTYPAKKLKGVYDHPPNSSSG